LFQTGDDLIGVFGKVEDTGKSNFGDIAQGKKTIPIWLAYNATDSKGKQLLKKYLGHKNITSEQANEVRAVIQQSGALKKVQELMHGYRETCLQMIVKMDLPSDLKKFLRGLVYYIETRDR
jgi:geranylgeranyl diphosphate synthase, type I